MKKTHNPSDDHRRAIASFREAPRAVLLACDVQRYAWGDVRAIPELMGRAADGQPQAELWMGAHPDLPSRAVVDGDPVPLDELLAAAPREVLGADAARAFGTRLPFLFKVLAAARPLSIQAHPADEQAREGFAREEAAGVPRTARERSYRDTSAKPELLVALGTFVALCGFRAREEIGRVLREVPELASLASTFDGTAAGLAALYAGFMKRSQEEVDAVLDPLLRRLEAEHARRAFARGARERWILDADRVFSGGGHRDRGLLSFYVLELVHLEPGEALFIPAGVLHAYLAGTALELMASSNNVLRGGLTEKHVDVPELLDTLRFDLPAPDVLRPERLPQAEEWIYRVPVSAFELRRIELAAGMAHQDDRTTGARIALVTAAEGPVSLQAAGQEHGLELDRGQAVLIPCGLPCTFRAAAPAVIHVAGVPPVGRDS